MKLADQAARVFQALARPSLFQAGPMPARCGHCTKIHYCGTSQKSAKSAKNPEKIACVVSGKHTCNSERISDRCCEWGRAGPPTSGPAGAGGRHPRQRHFARHDAGWPWGGPDRMPATGGDLSLLPLPHEGCGAKRPPFLSAEAKTPPGISWGVLAGAGGQEARRTQPGGPCP